MKHSLFLFIAFICLTGYVSARGKTEVVQPPEPPPQPAPRQPAPVRPDYSQRVLVNQEIVNWIQQVQHTDDIHRLIFYLDKSFSLEFDDVDHSPIVRIGNEAINDGMLIISARFPEPHLIFDAMQQGKITNFSPGTKDTFVINLTVEGKPVKLNFKKNASHDFFELITMDFSTGTYMLKSGEEYPKLFIFATIDENIRNDHVQTADFLAVPVSDGTSEKKAQPVTREPVNKIDDYYDNIDEELKIVEINEYEPEVTGRTEEESKITEYPADESKLAEAGYEPGISGNQVIEENKIGETHAAQTRTEDVKGIETASTGNRNNTPQAATNPSSSNTGMVVAVAQPSANQNTVRQNTASLRSNNIIAAGVLLPDDIFNFIKSRNRNPAFTDDYIRRLISIYIEEAKFEDVNHDFAIAQMLHRTNILGNNSVAASNNFAGLSRTDSWNGNFPRTAEFRNEGMREGVRAHIQHLKGYASTTIKRQQNVNPRHTMVAANIRGTVRTFDQLYERWTSDPVSYKRNIETLLNSLYSFAENQNSRR